MRILGLPLGLVALVAAVRAPGVAPIGREAVSALALLLVCFTAPKGVSALLSWR